VNQNKSWGDSNAWGDSIAFDRVVGDFFWGNKLWGTKNEPHNWLWEKVVGDFFWNFSLELWETIECMRSVLRSSFLGSWADHMSICFKKI